MSDRTRKRLGAVIVSLAVLGGSTAGAGDRDPGYLGVLLARENVDVSAEVAGIVREVRVELGERVEKGQVLISLESEDLRATLEQARAALSTAKARADHAAAEFAETDRLLARRRGATEIFTAEEVEALETRREVARAEREAASSTVAEREAALRELERRLDALDVRAPFAGAVAACHQDVGSRVAAGQSLVRLITAGDLWVRFAVPSPESGWLEVGRIVRVGPEGHDGEWSAEVRRVSPEVDPATDMVFVEASLTGAGREGGELRSGEIVRVHHPGPGRGPAQERAR